MATYDLTTTTPSKLETGDILNCPYSGTYKNITLPKGIYKLEVWGALGSTGYSGGGVGGNGGYSVGTLTLKSNTIAYLYSGGSGSSGSYNGGGRGTASDYYSYGGGGSDIRLGSTSLYARVIVAGGGGGGGAGAPSYAGGAGGGTSGITGSTYTTSYGAQCTPGTQTSGGTSYDTYSSPTPINGSFGNGGYILGSSHTGGGGGGWYGGGANGPQNGNSGGSGYIYTSSTVSDYPSGCLLNSTMYLNDASTIAGNVAFTSPTGTSETGHSGNGYCRITVVKANIMDSYVKVGGIWKQSNSIYIKVNGVWKESKEIYLKKDEVWKQVY